MLIFAADNQWYRRAGLALFIAQLGLFVFSLPPFHAGIWVQVEPVMGALFALAALNCLWLGIGFSKHWLRIPHPLDPLWLCLLLWVGWQTVPTALALSPWRSWFGPPESGEGMGWYVSALLTALLAAPLWQLPSYRRAMLWSAAIGIAILTVLHAANDGSNYPWRPVTWSAYLAHMVGWLFAAVMAGCEFRKVTPFVALAAFPAGVLIVSDNLTAGLLFPFAILLTGTILWGNLTDKNFFRAPDKIWRMLAVAACVAPMAWPVASQHWQWFPARQGGVGTRAELNQIVFATMRHEPSRWLIGGGWGRFSDDMFKYGMVEGTWHFHNGDADPNSYATNGNSYHSHDQPMEALLSLGLPGLLLWLAFPMLAMRRLPDARFWRVAPMLGALTALGYAWMPIAQMMAYQSLFWVAICAACAGKPQARAAPAWTGAALAAMGLLMLWSAWQQVEAMRYGEDLSDAIAARAPSSYSSEQITEDVKRGGDRMRAAVMHYVLWYADHPTGIDEGNAAGWYLNFLRAAHIAALSPRSGARLENFELVLQNILLLNMRNPAFNALKNDAMAFYPASIVRLAATAPLREDLAAPYLLYRAQATQGKMSEQIDLLMRLLAVDPDHRGALWLLGQALLKEPGHEEEGRDMLRHAASLGVERVWPVTDKELVPFK